MCRRVLFYEAWMMRGRLRAIILLRARMKVHGSDVKVLRFAGSSGLFFLGGAGLNTTFNDSLNYWAGSRRM